MNCLHFSNGRDGSEKKRRKDESTNGCLKKRNTEKNEKTWNESTKENLKAEDHSFKISRRTIFEKCRTIGRQDMMKR